jgi:hypothetical protein
MDGIEDRGNDKKDDQVERGMTAAQGGHGTEEGASAEERRRDAYRLW